MSSSVQSAIDAALYTPSAWGDTFHRLDVDEALGAGSAGPGKSMCLLMDPFQQVLIEHARCARNPGMVAEPDSWLYAMVEQHPLEWGYSTGTALHLRRVSTWLEETIARSHRIFPAIDPDAHWNEQKKFWTFRSGYKYRFGSCKDPNSWGQYQSSQFTHIAYDELTQFTEEQYEQINSRKRTSDPILKHFLKIRAMSNPMSQTAEDISIDDPFWVRRRFVDPVPEGRRILKRAFENRGKREYRTSIYLPATIDDNPDKEFVEIYRRELASKPEHIRQAYLYGNWYFIAGAYYSESFDPKLHIVKPFRIPRHFGRFRSMDWGYKAPGCIHWHAMDDDGNMIVERELTFQGKNPREVAKLIREIESDLGIPWKKGRSQLNGPADNQLWEERGDIGPTKGELFEQAGVSWVKADKRSRKSNSEVFEARLTSHHGRTTMPGIVFFEGMCPNAIKTIPGIGTKVDKKTKTSVPADGGQDHWLDSILYAVKYAETGFAHARAESVYDDDDDDDSETPTSSRRNWGYGAVA